jgi:hypothetical protein
VLDLRDAKWMGRRIVKISASDREEVHDCPYQAKGAKQEGQNTSSWEAENGVRGRRDELMVK